MKYIKIDCHYIRDKVMSRVISNRHVTSSHQLAGVFMKGLAMISCNATCTKLSMFDLYALAWGRMFDGGIKLLAHLGPSSSLSI